MNIEISVIYQLMLLVIVFVNIILFF